MRNGISFTVISHPEPLIRRVPSAGGCRSRRLAVRLQGCPFLLQGIRISDGIGASAFITGSTAVVRLAATGASPGYDAALITVSGTYEAPPHQR